MTAVNSIRAGDRGVGNGAEAIGASPVDSNAITAILARLLHQQLAEPRPSGTQLFHAWFKTVGSPYLFLFKRAASVTNIQYAELLALVRTYCNSTIGVSGKDLIPMFPGDVTPLLTAVLEQLPSNGEAACEAVAGIYAQIMSRIIVVRPLATSCAVLVPSHIDLDLHAITAASGYIHSCGHNVFVRHTGKRDIEAEFIQALRTHLARRGFNAARRAFLAVLSHEDFDDADSEDGDESASRDVDGAKLYVEKYYMGAKPLCQVMAGLERELADSVHVAPPGDHRVSRKEYLEREYADHDSTIWLIRDHGYREDGTVKRDDQYYVCYEQVSRSRSMAYCVDENKPAWTDHTTLPHSLMCAMINVSRHEWPTDRRVVFCDPFLGTGTGILEASKYSTVECRGRDLNPLTRAVISDNAAFFDSPVKVLQKWHALLGTLGDQKQLDRITLPSGEKAVVSDVLEAAQTIARGIVEREPQALASFGNASEFHRLCVYLSLRALRRGANAIQRGATVLAALVRNEARLLAGNVAAVVRIKELIETASLHEDSRTGLSYYRLPGMYSREVLPRLSLGPPQGDAVTIGSSVNLPESSYDLVVGDPPYGFNTTENMIEGCELFSGLARALVRSLRDGAHILLALPDSSYTGRQLPWYTNSTLFALQLQQAASEAGLRLEEPIWLETNGNLVTQPLYWESEKALRRRIIWLRCRRQPR